MDIREMLRRIQAGQSDRGIQRELGIHRDTVSKYRKWAEEQSLLEGPLPPWEELQRRIEETMPNTPPPQNVSTVEPYREQVEKMRQQNVDMKAIWERLKERGYEGSYSSVRRFVRRLEPLTPEVTVRVECAPGEEAQVDFGYAGKMLDPETGKERRAWVFVMTLSWSRHQFARFVFNQKLETWLDCHRRAFEFFGGVPERVVIDNLKAAIAKACWDDPEVQQAYRECAEHYRFLIGPCRPYTPQHKGKVERGGVDYVKRNFLGGREMTTTTRANHDVLRWCNETAGKRIHGTTKEKPLVRFTEVEKVQLKDLPDVPYDIGVWKVLKLHRDCYVHFDNAHYSAPFAYIGQRLRVRGGMRQVRIYTMDYRLIATHERADKPGVRRTNLDHLPQEKVPGLILTREGACERADAIGAATRQVVDILLDDTVVDRLRMVGRLLRLADDYGDDRLEAACRRALHFEDPAYQTVKRILAEGLDALPLPDAPVPAPLAQTFVRGAIELVGGLLGGLSWN